MQGKQQRGTNGGKETERRHRRTDGRKETEGTRHREIDGRKEMREEREATKDRVGET